MKHEQITKLYELIAPFKKGEDFTAAHLIGLFSDESVKAGKRNNSEDQKRVQTIHDMTKEMGVKCGVESKANARFSSEDTKMVETLHDHAVNLGAECGAYSQPVINDTSIGLKIDEMLCAFGTAVKSHANGHIGGKCVVFSDSGNLDSTKDYFDKTTEFDAKVGMSGPIYLHHTMPIATTKGTKTVSEKIGEATITEIGEDGIEVDGVLFEALAKSHDLYMAKLLKTVKKAIKSGKMGWSTGTAGHLVVREKQGEGFHIKRWPLGLDFSITPTPAGALQGVGVSMKSIQTEILEIEDDSPESGNAGVDELQNKNDSQVKLKGDIMTEQEVQAEVERRLAIKAAELEAEKKAQEKIDIAVQNGVKAGLEAAGFKVEAKNGGGFAVNRNTKTLQGDDASKAFNHFIKTGDGGGIRTGDAYEAMLRERGMKADYPLLESTQYQGQEAVPTEVANKIFEKRDPISIIRAAGANVIPCGSNAITLPIESQGATRVAPATPDASTDFKTDEIQKIDKVSATVYLFPAVSIIDNATADDATFDLEAWEGRRVARRMAVTENYYFLIGSGSSMPQGLTYGGTNGLATSSTSAATVTDLPNLLAKLKAEYRDNVSWFMSGEVEALYRVLVGSPFQLSNYGNPGGQGQQGTTQGTGTFILPGSRVFNSPDMQTAFGTSRIMAICANIAAGYTIVERKLLTVIRDPYTLSRKGATQIVWNWRNSGYVTNSAAVQYAKTASA
jgi:HK97 family phage major capsid protein